MIRGNNFAYNILQSPEYFTTFSEKFKYQITLWYSYT
jgi:hypothetical protein